MLIPVVFMIPDLRIRVEHKNAIGLLRDVSPGRMVNATLNLSGIQVVNVYIVQEENIRIPLVNQTA